MLTCWAGRFSFPPCCIVSPNQCHPTEPIRDAICRSEPTSLLATGQRTGEGVKWRSTKTSRTRMNIQRTIRIFHSDDLWQSIHHWIFGLLWTAVDSRGFQRCHYQDSVLMLTQDSTNVVMPFLSPSARQRIRKISPVSALCTSSYLRSEAPVGVGRRRCVMCRGFHTQQLGHCRLGWSLDPVVET
ncbi:hypothetical protein P152DRAFT_87059 [Eremomyces bilateralis CBS 781.70]|uniref:Uncharacterized protein n=1 Tax=Eremomyces bilateralis CBS 781.70 TaxID=1392243 RepID=A0A6G1FYZ0_9PEZI|nr:uncharacterized protein P152DRAFT_87059 [Eremomyces bilateralis CBS 781.70]KAF1810886.1 hypothetical protein P152DRAFT_87059 [Eremomyces bilateralis CBS 781.70]